MKIHVETKLSLKGFQTSFHNFITASEKKNKIFAKV